MRQERLDAKGELVELRFIPDRPRRAIPFIVRGEGIPIPPWEMELPLVRVPSPPVLGEDWPTRRKRIALAKFFKLAVCSRFGPKAPGLDAGFGRSSKTQALLDGAARVMIEHRIAPAAWVAWCCDNRVDFAAADEEVRAPSIWQVYQAAYIEQRRGWFRTTNASYGGRVVLTPAHRKLSALWAEMNAELQRVFDEPERWAAIVERFFPEGLHRDLAERVHAEVAERQQLYTRLALSGDKWIW